MTGWQAEGPTQRCCFKCLANTVSIPFYDCYETALWRQTLLTHDMFIASVLETGSYLSEIFNFVGFKHCMINGDLMHCGDLGVLQYLEGIVLYELLMEMGGRMTNCRHELHYILSLIKTASRRLQQHKQPLNNLTGTMVKGTAASSPKLKVKASAARNLLLCLEYMLEHLMPLESDHAQQRFLIVKHLSSMYRHLQSGEGIPSLLEAASCCKRALILWSELRRADIDPNNPHGWQHRGFFLWKMYPKHHLLQHVVEDQVLVTGNPVDHWCYADESEIGAAVCLAATLHVKCLHTSLIRKNRFL